MKRIFRPSNHYRKCSPNLRAEAAAAMQDACILKRAQEANDASDETIRLHNIWIASLNKKIRKELNK